ncbi:MAG TPA: calcium-binding protein, partial [Planctomycetota bacterium]|nr:calcium-binding protein [Planctomycetota bacterium]
AGPGPARGQAAPLAIASVDSAGLPSNGDSNTSAVSADGSFVAFVSKADNLVPGDGNQQADVFRHDLSTGATIRVSVGDAEQEAQLECVDPGISRDGRLVVFQSDAANLVAGDTNGFADIFLRDTLLGTTVRVSVGTHGNEAALPCVTPSISSDGRAVAFLSYSTNLGGGWSPGIQDVFVRDLERDTTECVSRGPHGALANHSSWSPSVSANGRFVAFSSQANNLVSFDSNGTHDVFVFDRRTGKTEMVSVSSSGAQGSGPSLTCRISGDGRFVAFTSYASNLVSGDDNTDSDVYLHDRQTGTTEIVSQNSLGQVGAEESDHPAISGDGRFVAFHSHAGNLGPLHVDNRVSDVFLRDRLLGITTCLSVGLHRLPGSEGSQLPAIAADLPVVAFESRADNLVSPDGNESSDVFVHVQD